MNELPSRCCSFEEFFNVAANGFGTRMSSEGAVNICGWLWDHSDRQWACVNAVPWPSSWNVDLAKHMFSLRRASIRLCLTGPQTMLSGIRMTFCLPYSMLHRRWSMLHGCRRVYGSKYMVHSVSRVVSNIMHWRTRGRVHMKCSNVWWRMTNLAHFQSFDRHFPMARPTFQNWCRRKHKQRCGYFLDGINLLEILEWNKFAAVCFYFLPIPCPPLGDPYICCFRGAIFCVLAVRHFW